MVSVVCTNYNKGDWIRTAIESFLGQQTEYEFEILLVDDKSTDNSKKIIQEYARKYPKQIRAFYNKKNLGITRTWVNVCKEVKGKYIARCDGDDYWVDNKKLQKQVDRLEASDDSQWCSTDSDTLDTDGTIQHAVFRHHLIDHATTYATMLATRGFTAPSTWVVRTDLMQKVNSEIDMQAVDDTFNIQLELFNRTKLTYLPESTAVYRINEGSDSRPRDIQKIKARNDGLLKTQLEYVKKYKDVEYGEIIEILLKKNNDYDVLSADRLRIIREMELEVKNLKSKIIDRDKQIQKRDEQIISILNSKRYKLGKMLVSPVSLIKPKSGK